MQTTRPKGLKLGLIGDKIASSRAPLLHRLAGRHSGISVTYDRLVPAEMGLPFDAVFDHAQHAGYHGINVTYPYKERAAKRVQIGDPMVQAMGAVNTVVFATAGPQGHNTDYSGFMAAYRGARGTQPPGTLCLIGAGGAGRAIGFALLSLGAQALRCVDTDETRARALADALAAMGSPTRISAGTDVIAAAKDATGLINATPLGMDGDPRSALPASAMAGASWAFDAVYTPVDTPFLQRAEQAGAQVVSGLEMFFGQGFDAWDIFSNHPADRIALRRAVLDASRT